MDRIPEHARVLTGGHSHMVLVPEMSHGGLKHAGYGNGLSKYGFEDYTRIKHVMHSFS